MSEKTAYIVVEVRIDNTEAYERYKQKVVPIVTQFGGEYLVRGGEMDVIQDELWSPTRMVLLKFPSRARALKFIHSDEYAPVKQMRLDNSAGSLVVLEGV